jgi:competence protein ComEC
MNYLLEGLIKNKLFLILPAIICGIGIRFRFHNDDDFLVVSGVVLVSFYVVYRFLLSRYISFVINQDLSIFSKKNLNKSAFLIQKRYLFGIIALIFLTSAAVGFVSASFRFNVMTPKTKLVDQINQIKIIGKVKQFEIRDNGSRIYLKNVFEVDDEKILQKLDFGIVRINLRQKIQSENIIGEWILLRVTLMPPPPPAFPNSFDFSQYAFFKGIGAIGYSHSGIEILDGFQRDNSSILDLVDEKLNTLRKTITLKIKSAIPEPSSSIAAAILVGENAQINPDDYYSLRVSGLAHIIAISGMHVVVVVAIAFFFIRAILLYLVPLVTNLQPALYFSISKASAIFSILLSTFYVMLAGAPVSAQRALITSSILMLCLVYDRHIHPIRSLCIAAIIMLVVTPEALFAAGLQMSFAACFALIATFELSDEFFKFKSKYFEYFFKLIIASAAASIATAPFIIYHFNQFAPYGIIANLICVPLSDFIIMPFGMLSMLLMPFGLDKFTLIPLEYSVDFMMWIAKVVSKLPHSDIHVAGFTNLGIAIVSIGFFIFCINTQKRIKLSGLIIAIAGCFFVHNKDNIILLVSTKSFAVRHDMISNSDDKNFIFSSRQRDRFSQEVWQGKIGKDNFLKESLNALSKKKKFDITQCNSDFCIVKNKNNIIVILNSHIQEEGLAKCNEVQPQIFINMYDDTVCRTAQNNITHSDLKKHGTHVINENLEVIRSVEN